jgi:hypothetical protein
LLNRVRVKNIGRVNRFTINPEWDNYYLKIQVTFTWTSSYPIYKKILKKLISLKLKKIDNKENVVFDILYNNNIYKK